MALKIEFGENSLPLEVRNGIHDAMPALPRAYIIGLKAISDIAFTETPQDNLMRLDEAVELYVLANYYAPEYYSHTNSQLPEHVLTVLAGEMELEHSEDLDDILPDKAAALLAEVREIRANPDLLHVPKTSLDATFVTLIKYCHEIMSHQQALLCGEERFDCESYDTLYQAQYDYLRDCLLDPGNTDLEMMIFQSIQAINFLRNNADTPHFWFLPVLQAPDFDDLDDEELIKRCGLPEHDIFTKAFSLAHEKLFRESNSESDVAFVYMAEELITPLRRYLEMSACDDPGLASYLLLERELDDPDFLDKVVDKLGEEGDRIAYLHAALEDDELWKCLPDADQRTLTDFYILKASLQLIKEWQYFEMLDTKSYEFVGLGEQIIQSRANLQDMVSAAPALAPQIEAFALQQLEITTPPEAPEPVKAPSGGFALRLV